MEFQIVNDSKQAEQGIDALAQSLSRLKTAISGGTSSLNKTASGIRNLSNALKSINAGDMSQKLGRITTSLRSLSELSAVKIPSNINTQLTKLGVAINSIKWTDGEKLTALADGLRPLSSLSTSKLTSFINQLSKLPSVAEALDKVNINKFSAQMAQLATAMKPFASEMQQVANGFAAFPSRIQKLVTSTNNYNGAAETAEKKTNRWAVALSALKLTSIVYVINRLAKGVASVVYDASEWEGVMYRFGRAFGDSAEDAYREVEKISSLMSIDKQTFMQYSSIFGNMLQGYGVSQVDASKMAMNYTEMAYDIWAGYNDMYTSFEDAATAVRSAISGEVEPIRRAGFTIVDSQLKITAANYGIAYSSQSASEELKSYLRYLTLYEQMKSQNLIGTYANELNTAEGLLRALRQQVISLANELGSLLLPIFAKIIPYIQGFVAVIREAVASLAALFGVTIQKLDFSGAFGAGANATEEMADNLSSAAGSAKKLKQYTMGFDELNIINPNSGSGSGSGASGGSYDGMFDIEKLWDDAVYQSVQNQVEALKEKCKELLKVVLAIGAGIAAWKIVSALPGSTLKEKLGAFLAIAGAVETIVNFTDAWVNGLNTANLVGMFSGIASTVAGLALVFGGFGAAMGAVFGGIILIVSGLWDTIRNGGEMSTQAFVAIEAGIVAVGIALAALVSPWTLIVAGIVAVSVAVYKYWDEISAFLKTTGADIKAGFSAVGTAFHDTVLEPITTNATEICNALSLSFSTAKEDVINAWNAVTEWFSNFKSNVIQIVADLATKIIMSFRSAKEGVISAWNAVVLWFTDTVINPLSNAFSLCKDTIVGYAQTLWNTITGIFAGVGEWFDTNVVGVVKTAIKTLVNAAISLFESMLNGIIGAINRVIRKANSLVEALGFDPIREINEVHITRLMADGGMVNEGELFIAREAGAEMVGAIGNRTAVANNDQIVEAVSSGVYAAVSVAISENSNNNSQPVIVYLDGQQIYNSVQKTKSERGRSLMGAQLGYSW